MPLLFFLIKNMVYREKLYIEKNRFFSVDYVKTNGPHDCTHMTSHTIWVDEMTGVNISIKKVNKNWNFCNAPPPPPHPFVTGGFKLWYREISLFIGWCYTVKRHGESRILKVTLRNRANQLRIEFSQSLEEILNLILQQMLH